MGFHAACSSPDHRHDAEQVQPVRRQRHGAASWLVLGAHQGSAKSTQPNVWPSKMPAQPVGDIFRGYQAKRTRTTPPTEYARV